MVYDVGVRHVVSEMPADQHTIVGKGDRGSSPRILFKIYGDLAYITIANEPGGGQKPDFSSNMPVVDGKRHYVAFGFLEKNFYFVCGDRHWQYHSIDPRL